MSVSPEDLARTLLRRASARRAGDERDRDACLRAVSVVVPAARAALNFRRVWIIGSLAWGRFGLRSDIDVVVEGAGTEVLVGLSDKLGEATGRSVDVLAFEKLTPAFQSRVLAEGRHVA